MLLLQLCGKAQAWANHLAHTNAFLYENDKSVGENIFCRLSSDAQIDISGMYFVEICGRIFLIRTAFDFRQG